MWLSEIIGNRIKEILYIIVLLSVSEIKIKPCLFCRFFVTILSNNNGKKFIFTADFEFIMQNTLWLPIFPKVSHNFWPSLPEQKLMVNIPNYTVIINTCPYYCSKNIVRQLKFALPRKIWIHLPSPVKKEVEQSGVNPSPFPSLAQLAVQ